MTTRTKMNFGRRIVTLEYIIEVKCQLFKRRFEKHARILLRNFLKASAIVFFVCIIIFITSKWYTKAPKDVQFQSLLGDFDFGNETLHYNENIQFETPEIEAERKDWHDYAAMAADKKRIGPGEAGAPVFNKDDGLKHIENYLATENGFNAFVSDLISVNRSLPDVRDYKCRKKRYLAKLPTVSIVIPCRNEYNSVLQRTLHSIVNRTPKELLKEIIIVDDNSNRGYTVEDMAEYATQHFPNLIKFVRLQERKGLINAKVAGAKVAKADVLVFFDSHIECNYNWLPPLLEPIAINERIVTTPCVDVIYHADFSYNSNTKKGYRGGFNWDMHYSATSFSLKEGADYSKPFKDPVMMGGLFAISRRFFWELGGYDIGLDIWGAEQYELSFKIWMCGGMLLVAPCSRAGHLFRNPEYNKRDTKNDDYLMKNNKRVAEVWMDDYKKYVYETNPEIYNKLDVGDLTEQHAIRKRLNCYTFKWYLEFVAPDILEHSPIESGSLFASGAIQSVARPLLCLDTMNFGIKSPVGIFSCAKNRKRPHANQFWSLNQLQELKNPRRNMCLDVFESTPNAEVIMYQCHHQGGNQFWYYDKNLKWLIHDSNGNRCLELLETYDEEKIVVNECNEANVRMKWLFGFVNDSMTPNRFVFQ